ncbi:MAG: 2-hydroxyacid dehydrogenase [Chloroflexota bacterium]
MARQQRPVVYVTRAVPLAALDRVRAVCDVTGEATTPPSREMLMTHVRSAEGIFSLLTEHIDAEVMDAAPDLKVISNMAVGYDNVDVAAATARGIPVGNTPGVLTDATADLTWSLMLAAARRLPEGERYIARGHWKTWEPDLLLGVEVTGATLGVVGLGRIGTAVARRAQGFDMRILYHRGDEAAARRLGAQSVDLPTLLKESDFVSLHVPLKQETYHLIDAAALAQMKSSAVLINTARGPVVDPEALYDALHDGRIRAAALDVTEPEPIPADHPLLKLDNCLIVPHLGSSTVATREKMAALAVANLLAGLRGERLPHCVNPEVYE